VRALIAIALVACGRSEPTDPLAVLQDTSKAWTYDVVAGKSIDALAPVPAAPTVRCKVTKPESFLQTKKIHRAIECNPTAQAPASPLNRVMFKRMTLIFDRDRVREVYDLGDGIRSALGFSFPRALAASTWTYDNEERSVKSHVEVRAETRDVLGKQRTVWVATGTYSTEFDGDKGGPTLGAAIFAPKLGPVLMCDHDNDTKTYSCLRLAGVSEVKKIAPKLSPKLPSIPERNALVTMLATMDHEGDYFYDILAGKLVVRDDLPVSPGVMAPTIVIEDSTVRLAGEVVALAVLKAQLVEAQTKIVEDIDRHRVPRDMDQTALREQINLLVDGATPWQLVREVLESAANAGFVQPQLVFARTPSAQPPPPHPWVDEVVRSARLEGNLAGELGKLTRTILDDCEELRSAFAIYAESKQPAADQIIGALVAKIPTSTCHYDIAALRAALWAVFASPHPHGLVGVRIDPSGKTIDLPDATPWREAHAKLAPGMKLKL
jgi:hypothetical protein